MIAMINAEARETSGSGRDDRDRVPRPAPPAAPAPPVSERTDPSQCKCPSCDAPPSNEGDGFCNDCGLCGRARWRDHWHEPQASTPLACEHPCWCHEPCKGEHCGGDVSCINLGPDDPDLESDVGSPDHDPGSPLSSPGYSPPEDQSPPASPHDEFDQGFCADTAPENEDPDECDDVWYG